MVTLQVNLPDMYCCMFFDTKNFYNTTNHDSQHTTHLSATYIASNSATTKVYHITFTSMTLNVLLTQLMESASLFNQFLCHATSGQVHATLSPVLIDDNIKSQMIANKPSVIVTAPVALPPAQNQQLFQQLYQ